MVPFIHATASLIMSTAIKIYHSLTQNQLTQSSLKTQLKLTSLIRMPSNVQSSRAQYCKKTVKIHSLVKSRLIQKLHSKFQLLQMLRKVSNIQFVQNVRMMTQKNRSLLISFKQQLLNLRNKIRYTILDQIFIFRFCISNCFRLLMMM